MKKTLVALLALAAAVTMSFTAMAQEEETAEEAIIEIETEEAAEEAELFAEEEPAAEVTAENAVAKVGSTYYATIDDAIAAWTNGTTLTLLADVQLSEVYKFNSTESRTLNLGTYTLTAAAGENAIEIVCNGQSKATYGLTVNADATNPGGINAPGKSCIYYRKSGTTQDRVIIRIDGGIFNGSYAVNVYSSNRGTNCPQVSINGGIFNGNVNIGHGKLIAAGGTFNGWINCTGDSTAYRQISGGKYKSWQSMTADATNKFWVGTSLANYNVGVYVDDDGYLVVGGPVITEMDDRFEAFTENYGGWSSYLKYSSAAEHGLYYTKWEEFAADNNEIKYASTVILDEEYSKDMSVSKDVNLTIDMSADSANYTGDVTLGHKDATFTVIFDSENPYTGTVTPYPGYALDSIDTQGTIVTRKYFNVTPVAKIGDTGYATLGEAIKAAQSNDTIMLVGNVTEDVTINKNITIDGADKDYTGTMTISKSINLTVDDVNFIGGNILKGKNTGAQGTYTIKNCDFDSDSSAVYAIEIRGTSNIIIENCTSEGYYGFLQVPSSNDSISIKDVTIKDTEYSIKVDYSNGVSLENVTIENSTYGFVNSNYGSKTIAVKNCTVKANYPLVIWDRNTKIVNTFKFEGDNDFGSNAFYYQAVTEEEMGYTKYVLGENATLTACEGLNVTPELDDYVVRYNNGTYANVLAVAKIGDDKFATLTEAFAVASASADGTVIELLPVTITEGTVKLPATLTNVTLKGVEGAVIKDTTIMAADGNSLNYDGFTVDGVTFVNSSFSLTGWRTGGTIFKDFVFTNNVFKDINNESNTAAIHINLDASEAVKNFTVNGNVFENILGGQKSAIYAQTTGKTFVDNNLINNVAFRPFVIQITTDDGINDTFKVTNNTFRGSASGRLQALGNNPAGTDAVAINVNDNAIIGTSDSQQICFWNLNDEVTTANLANNYYEYNPVDNPSKFYYNSSAASYADIIAMGVLPYYTEATFGEDGKYTALTGLVDGRTADITVEFAEVLPEIEGERTYNINLVANDESTINRLNSGDFTFTIDVTDGKVAYEIIDIANDNITVSPVDNSNARYEFHFDTKENVGNDTAKIITIAQVKFTGYGEFSFAIENNNTNAVHTTTTDDNIVDTYLPEGKIESDGTEAEGVLNLGTGIPATYIYVPTRDLTINLSFPNTVENKAVAYQQMKVTISGGDLENAIVIDLGNDAEMPVIATSVKPDAAVSVTDGSVYQVVIANALTYDTAYNVEVTGAGYRTARYTVTMQGEDTDGKVLNFWNNVKDNAVEVEEDKASSAKNVTFLAGDIVKDSTINIYDLSAVVSYFGEIELNDATKSTYKPEYAKYDLNRDGKIDSKDVAYVLVSWGK